MVSQCLQSGPSLYFQPLFQTFPVRVSSHAAQLTDAWNPQCLVPSHRPIPCLGFGGGSPFTGLTPMHPFKTQIKCSLLSKASLPSPLPTTSCLPSCPPAQSHLQSFQHLSLCSVAVSPLHPPSPGSWPIRKHPTNTQILVD